MNMQVYLDNSATTRPSDAVVAAMVRAMEEGWHNPSALYRPAMEAEKQLTAAREACLAAAGASGHKLLFTSGGTEADNMAVLGFLRTVKKPGRVLIMDIEHPAITACAQEIARMGHHVEQLPVRRDGTADIERLETMLGDDVHLICMMQVNNETGAIQPIAETVQLRNRLCPKAAIHVDGVQGFLRVPFDFARSGVQSYAFSGHKIHACKGVGGLILRKDHRISPIVFGGGQEEGLRSGTENTPGIIGLAEAVRTYPKGAFEEMAQRKQELHDALKAAVPALVVNGPEVCSESGAPHILNVSLPPVRSQTMLFALEGDGIYVSAGSACSSHKQKVSSVLTAMGVTPQMADCALRFSLCPGITSEEIQYVAQRVAAHYQLLSRYVRR